MKPVKTIKSVAVETLKGRVSNQEAVATPEAEDLGYKVVGAHKDFPEIEEREGTFKIKVKDDDDKVLFESKNEPFRYYAAPSLASALKYLGAKLDDSQMQFMAEALKGSEETGKAVSKLIEIFNADERASKKQSAYSSKYNEKKPITEEQIENAHASILRNYLKTNPGTSDETALQALQNFGIIPKDFTLDDYRDNKGKR